MGGLIWLVGIIILLVGLLQLPLLCDLIRSVAPNAAPKRIVGPVLDAIVVFVMCFVFAAVFHMFFWFFLPAHVAYKGDGNTELLHKAIFWFLYLNALSNYICSAFTKAGNPPKVTITPDNAMSISIERCIPKEKICAECKCVKAETTHHCSVCKECVLYMDHHCPFVMGCVGLNNFHFFYSFMVYFYSGMWYAVYLSFPPFWHCHISYYTDRNYNCTELSTASILSVVVLLNLVGATFLNAFNFVALFSNSSTMSCIIEILNIGFFSAARTLFSQLSLNNIRNTRSRLHVLLLSKRSHALLFLVPPIGTAGRLFVAHCLSRKRTINFTFPTLPKKAGSVA